MTKEGIENKVPKITIREIRDKYLASKEKEKAFKWTYYVRRPMSYYLAVPFLRLGVSATSVTVLWLIIAAIGCGFLASGNHVNMIIGALLLEFAVILDCVDGHIARFTRTTRSGDMLDTWVGEILLISSMISMGIGLLNSSEPLVINSTGIFQIDKLNFLYMGFFGGFAALMSWTVRLHWRTVTPKLSSNNYGVDRFTSKSGKSRMILIVNNIFHYSGAFTMCIVIASIFHAIDVALILITVNYGTYMIAVIYRIIGKAKLLDSNGEGE